MWVRVRVPSFTPVRKRREKNEDREVKRTFVNDLTENYLKRRGRVVALISDIFENSSLLKALIMIIN